MKILSFIIILGLGGSIVYADCPNINLSLLAPFKENKNATIKIVGSSLERDYFKLANPEEDVKNLPTLRGKFTGNLLFQLEEEDNIEGTCTYTYRGVMSKKQYSFTLQRVKAPS